jgi:hypothetical protein
MDIFDMDVQYSDARNIEKSMTKVLIFNQEEPTILMDIEYVHTERNTEW